jgi:hypothetical protein
VGSKDIPEEVYKPRGSLVIALYRVISIRGVVCLFFMGANNGVMYKFCQDLAAIS